MTGNRINLMIFAVILMLLVLAGCNEKQIPTQVPVEFHPTAADAVERSQGTGTTSSKTEDASRQLAGDPLSGEQLFADNGCTACHSTGEETIIGPGLAGIYARSEGRVDSRTAEAYIEESIREPGAFVVDGFTEGLMPSFDDLSASEITDLIAYLKTLN